MTVFVSSTHFWSNWLRFDLQDQTTQGMKGLELAAVREDRLELAGPLWPELAEVPCWECL